MFHFSIVDIVFLQFMLVIVIFGILLNVLEPFLPICVRQSFRYGKHAYNGVTCNWISRMEMPKSNFKHFYVSSVCFSSFSVYMAIYIYYFNGTAPKWFTIFLNFWCGNERVAKVSNTSTFLALSLLYLQCLRRLYETHCIQVFSPKSKINLSHYIVGHFHYFGAFMVILSQAEGFAKYGEKHISTSNIIETAHNILMAIIFILAWINQFRTNIILANLRKDKKNGSVISHKHIIPNGGWFDLISSPHMLCEIVMYLSLGGILYKNSSWWLVMAWVVSNQTESALLTHWWYQSNFPDYPKSRRAIYPYII